MAAATLVGATLGWADAVGADDVGQWAGPEGIQTLLGGCTAPAEAPLTVVLTAPINGSLAGDPELRVACHVVVDLAGFDLRVRNVVIAAGQSLEVTDSAGGARLTADADGSTRLAGGCRPRGRRSW